jgi:hypothetical protein
LQWAAVHLVINRDVLNTLFRRCVMIHREYWLLGGCFTNHDLLG